MCICACTCVHVHTHTHTCTLQSECITSEEAASLFLSFSAQKLTPRSYPHLSYALSVGIEALEVWQLWAHFILGSYHILGCVERVQGQEMKKKSGGI